ncbi:hypothetical protein [Pseudomonas sp. E102]|uniref:hypothetical protein n=1 Tax=Pseudomonas sp. E102 TaxID=181579 RepID=UPI0040461A72
MKEFNTITTPMLERLLAVAQIKHCLYVQQSAVTTGDKQEYRRATDSIDKLTTEYGVEVLRQAQDELL